LISGRSITDSTIAYSFIAPSFSAYRRIVSALEKSKFKVKVLRVGKFESKTNVLTEKQQRILWIALQTGYFDYPKRVDSKELSSRLGSAPQHSQRSPEEEQEGFWNTISKGDHDTTRGVYMINRFIYILCK
jgi:predicted DNA binding protein